MVGRGSRGRTSRARTLKGPAALLRGGSVAPSVEGRKGPRTYVTVPFHSIRFDPPVGLLRGARTCGEDEDPEIPGGRKG